jgi:thiol-disulfide isomerase/thioredoxin
MNLQLGPLAFQLAHLLVLACALLTMAVGWLVGRKRQVGISDVMLDMAFAAALVGRLVFVARWFSIYQDDPWSAFDIRDGGFEPWSAALAALLVAVWRVRQRPALLRPLVSGLVVGVGMWAILVFTGFAGAPSPQTLPIVRLTDLSGAPAPLVAAANGRVKVVNLWASWCPPCRREMPTLARAQARYPQVDFVFVNQGESAQVVRRYLERMPFHLERVLVDEGNLLGKAMQSSALPMTLIYRADGKLAFSHQGLISEAVLTMQLERCCQVRR